MMRLVGLVCLVAAAYSSASGRTINNAASPHRLPSEYLVSVKPDMFRGQSLENRMDVFVDKMAAFSDQISVVARYDFTTLSVLHIKSDSETLVSQLYDFPEVSFVEANLKEYALDQNCVNQNLEMMGLWGLARISKVNDNSERIYRYRANDGAGTAVYLLDAGLRITHNDYGGRAYHGYKAPNIDDPVGDRNGHGTHCAGTVMSSTYGVAKGAEAIDVKVLNDQGVGVASDVIAGLNWVLGDFRGRPNTFAAVVSISLRFTPNDAMDAIIKELFDAGLPTTSSAGNQGQSSCLQSPARAEFAIAVMSADVNNVLAIDSSFGPCANIIAPGVAVASTYYQSDTQFWHLSGTSMACPHAAGALLRYMSQMIQQNGSRPTATQARNWLLNSSTRGQIDLRGRPDTNNWLVYAPCDIAN